MIQFRYLDAHCNLISGTQNAGRRLLDGFNLLSDTVVAISSAPTKSVSGWVADQVLLPPTILNLFYILVGFE